MFIPKNQKQNAIFFYVFMFKTALKGEKGSQWGLGVGF